MLVSLSMLACTDECVPAPQAIGTVYSIMY